MWPSSQLGQELRKVPAARRQRGTRRFLFTAQLLFQSAQSLDEPLGGCVGRRAVRLLSGHEVPKLIALRRDVQLGRSGHQLEQILGIPHLQLPVSTCIEAESSEPVRIVEVEQEVRDEL